MEQKPMTANQRAKHEAKLLKIAAEEGFRNVRMIEGVVCALQPFAYTWGIVVGIDECGYARRYCYEKFEDALIAFSGFENVVNSHPGGPWIKVKGMFQGRHVDDLNPLLFAPSPVTGLMERKPQRNDNGNESGKESQGQQEVA